MTKNGKKGFFGAKFKANSQVIYFETHIDTLLGKLLWDKSAQK